jgi:hypothetical protein
VGKFFSVKILDKFPPSLAIDHPRYSAKQNVSGEQRFILIILNSPSSTTDR